jgi:DNA-binding CsgD family transcriptional regulator/predicted ATPase
MSNPDFSSTLRTPLVGRDLEFERMQAALDGVTGGHGGRMVLISGEPGIGKTRLVEELAAAGTDQGALVAWGRVDDVEGAPPYWPWIQVLESLVGQADRELVVEALRGSAGPVAAVAPWVGDFVKDIPTPPVLDPAAGRFRLHTAVVDLLVAMCADRPVVLILDDMHWADVSSLELTRFAAPRIVGARILVVVTYRDVDGGNSDSFDVVLASLAREPGLERIALHGLSEAEVARFMAQTIGMRPRTGTASTVHARTEGNPFFVGELARLLQSEGRLGSSAGAEDGPVPAGVRDVVRRRLARLPGRTRELFVLGAVLGREFEVGLLAAAAGIGVGEAAAALEPGLGAKLVCEVGGSVGRVRFSHALVRDTVYGELSALRRATLHAGVGEALERSSGPRLAELAWHFFHAAPVLGPDRGLAYVLAAAEAAEAAVSHERAEDDLRRALRLVELLPAGTGRWEKELEVQNRLVALMVRTRGFAAPEVGRASTRARALCEEIGETDALFKALNHLANYHHLRGDLTVAAGLGAQLLRMGEQRSNVMWLTAGHLFLGMAELHAGRLHDAQASLAALREVAGELDLSSETAESFFGLHPLVMALLYSARSAWTLGEEGQARSAAAEGVRVATRLGHPHTLAFAVYLASHLEVLAGDAPGVLGRSEAAIALCDEHGLTAYRGFFRLLRGWARCAEGRADEGVAEIAAEVAANRAGGARLNDPFFLSLHAEGEARRGARTRALGLVEEALAGIGEDRLWASLLHCQRGELLAGLGPDHHAAAGAALREATMVARAQGAVPFARRAEAALAVLEPTGGPSPPPVRPVPVSNLSLREREVIGLLGRGLTDKEIARDLVISLATVRSHLDRIRDKTGRRRRPELSRLADELGLTGV